MLWLKTLHFLKAQVSNSCGILHLTLFGMLEDPNLISSHYEGPVVLLAMTNRPIENCDPPFSSAGIEQSGPFSSDSDSDSDASVTPVKEM